VTDNSHPLKVEPKKYNTMNLASGDSGVPLLLPFDNGQITFQIRLKGNVTKATILLSGFEIRTSDGGDKHLHKAKVVFDIQRYQYTGANGTVLHIAAKMQMPDDDVEGFFDLELSDKNIMAKVWALAVAQEFT
jgi:hypothetical protein